MKIRSISILLSLLFLILPNLAGQEPFNFPFDPYQILKTWNYDKLLASMGAGEEILTTQNQESFISGIRYKSNLMGIDGKLEFSFYKDSIARIIFRFDHGKRVVSTGFSDSRTRDPSTKKEFDDATRKLDSIQRLDSLSRDTIVQAISKILGHPLSNAPTPVTEKLARHLAIWINKGYTCQYKDYFENSEIIFSIATIPPKTAGEYDIPLGSQILRKMPVSTKKLGWTASLIGVPSQGAPTTFSDYFLMVEFSTGQSYLTGIPKNPVDFLENRLWLEFPGNRKFHLSVPIVSVGYLPSLEFQDCNGDAIPEAWIRIPLQSQGNLSRHALYNLAYKEPYLILDSDEILPSFIRFGDSKSLTIGWADGTQREILLPENFPDDLKPSVLSPQGFDYFNTTQLNSDGSSNFVAGITIHPSPGEPSIGILEFLLKHTTGGWEISTVQAKNN